MTESNYDPWDFKCDGCGESLAQTTAPIFVAAGNSMWHGDTCRPPDNWQPPPDWKPRNPLTMKHLRDLEALLKKRREQRSPTIHDIDGKDWHDGFLGNGLVF